MRSLCPVWQQSHLQTLPIKSWIVDITHHCIIKRTNKAECKTMLEGWRAYPAFPSLLQACLDLPKEAFHGFSFHTSTLWALPSTVQLWSEVLQLFTEEGKEGPSGPNLEQTLGSSLLFPDFPLCHLMHEV